MPIYSLVNNKTAHKTIHSFYSIVWKGTTNASASQACHPTQQYWLKSPPVGVLDDATTSKHQAANE
jgi:hypothetical protein